MKNLLLILIAAPQFLIGQITLIPDANFEQKLVALGIDNAVNGSILTANAAAVTDLNVSASNISNLTGIEAFTSLTYLNCSDNNLTSLNVAPILTLQELECNGNNLTSLNITPLVNLRYLEAYDNQLSSINVTSNTALQYLGLDENDLTTLDVTLNIALKNLYCGSNSLTSLDLSHNAGLKSLDLYLNNLSTINLSMNTQLDTLNLELNHITSIDLTQLTNLKRLKINDNQLTSLSIAQNHMLDQINCSGNLLTQLDLRNGNNINFILTNNGAFFNPGLSCISVDNPAYSIANWGTNFHETATYSSNCLLTTHVSQLQTTEVYPNPSKGKIFIGIPESVTIDKIAIMDINGRIIKSIKPNELQPIYEIDLSDVNKGIYFATIESSGSQLTKKIILQ